MPLLHLVLLLAATQVAVPAPVAEPPRQVMRLARYVVEGDSAPAVGERWAERLARDSTDRGALLGLATMARLTADEPTAERLYRRLLGVAPARDDPYGIYARLGIARLRYEAIQMGVVDSLVSEALAGARALHDSAAEGDALQALGNARVDVDKRAGLAYQDSALRVLPASETDVIAGVRCRRALMLFVAGDSRARDALASALEYARRVQAPRGEANCLRATARDLWARGLEDSSIASLRRAIVILRRVRDRRSLAFTLTTLADVLRDHGAFGEARDALRESLEQAHVSHYAEGEALALHMLGTLHYSLRDLPAAARYFDRASAVYDSMSDTLSRFTEIAWRANIARDAGDLAHARTWTLEALGAARRTGGVTWSIELFQALADIEMLAGDWGAATAALDSAERVLRVHGIETWRRKLVYQRGRLALHRGDLDAAERIFRGYLRGLAQDEPLRQHETRAYLADILARRGDLAEAERELTAAGDALDAWRATLDDRQLRVMAFQATATDESDRNSSVPRVLAALAAGGRTNAAFGLAERRRARELREHLVQASALETSASAGAPGTPTASAVATSIGAPEIAGLLPEGTALIEYVTGALGAPTTAFVVTRGRAARARVLAPADSLIGPIGRFVALVSRDQEARPEADALGRALLEPVLASLDPVVTRLIIVPDGPLHRVPWDALRLGDGRYVVEHYAVGIAPSAGALGALWHRPRPRPAPGRMRLLAFGDPAFAARGDSSRAYADLLATSGGLSRLPGSRAEARLVARYAPAAEVRLGDEASAEYLRHAQLDGVQVLHFATHALVDDRALGRTALALAPGSSGSGFVTPGELASLRLDADMVVLSACRTAGGVVVDGEGIQGLTAAFLEAGARSVVATSWRVGDRRTVGLVERLYAELARGKPLVEALRAAKLASLRRGDPPGQWAAFNAVGDPLVVVPLRTPPSQQGWWVGAGGLAIVLVAAAAARRRRAAAAQP